MRKLIAVLWFVYLKGVQARKISLPPRAGEGNGPRLSPLAQWHGQSCWRKTAVPEPQAAENSYELLHSWDRVAKISFEAAAEPAGASGASLKSVQLTLNRKERYTQPTRLLFLLSQQKKKKSKSHERKDHDNSKVRKKRKVKSHRTKLK